MFIQTQVPDELYEMKLREPDNRIPKSRWAPTTSTTSVRRSSSSGRASRRPKPADRASGKRTPAPAHKPAPAKNG